VHTIAAVSLEELRQAMCRDDDSQHDSSSRQSICESLCSDSELSFPQQKTRQVTSDFAVQVFRVVNGNQ